MLYQIFLLNQAILAMAKCAFSVDAAGDPYEVDQEPLDIGENAACPFFSNTPVCCVQSQIESMMRDYKSLDATFGSDGGGCDYCAANMKRFWCEYTCSPKQREFVKVTGRKNITDPLNSSNILDVQTIALTVHPLVACQVFGSCKRTSFASQVSAMSSPGGFFTFQGEQAASQGGQYIDVSYSPEGALFMDNLHSCSKNTNLDPEKENFDEYGFLIKENCGCNTCEDSCDASQILFEPQGVFYGFEGYYVLFAWSWAIIFAIGVTVYRECRFRQDNQFPDQMSKSLVSNRA